MEKIKALIAAIIIIIVGLVFVFLTRQDISPVTKKKILLDTYVSITVYQSDKKSAQKAIDKAFDKMAAIEKKSNRYDNKSEISKINRQSGKRVKASSDIFKALELAKRYNSISGGYYDITVGKVVSLWDFNKKNIPSKSDILKAKSTIDPKGLVLIPPDTVKTSKGTELDLGSVAKGQAVDSAEQKLSSLGIKNALITTGSSTTLMGDKPNNEPWRVGIQHPREQDDLLAVIKGKDITISTSGDYQQYFIKNGRRFNHIINPKTGYPQDDFMSVTVISSKKAIETDIISTAIFAMGIKKGISFAKKIGVDYITVTSKGKILQSKEAGRYLERKPLF